MKMMTPKEKMRHKILLHKVKGKKAAKIYIKVVFVKLGNCVDISNSQVTAESDFYFMF